MMKKVVLLLVVVFVGFYLFNDPNGLAENVKEASAKLWDGLLSLFDALIDFINAITS